MIARKINECSLGRNIKQCCPWPDYRPTINLGHLLVFSLRTIFIGFIQSEVEKCKCTVKCVLNETCVTNMERNILNEYTLCPELFVFYIKM